jgi:ABC-2 type transport system permease protein
MNKSLRAIIAALLVIIIMFSGITICQQLGKSMRLDITQQKIYTLSDGSKNILAKLGQPITMKFYYAKTAASKGPDQIRFFNEYYYFVKSLLEEYQAAAKGMVKLEIIDPRPYSDQEAQALRYGLKRLAITEEESFFFGLVVETQLGSIKTIEFFSPDRQNFIEYDISFLIDTAITREKKRIGILSSLPVLGDDVTGYMAQMMRMQGQQPQPAWTFVEHLRNQYEVSQIAPVTDEIKDIDLLMVIHPKALDKKTLFAIDQFVLQGGRTIVCVDPHCLSDPAPPQQQFQRGEPYKSSSNLNQLLRTWGVEMPEKTFAGDRNLAIRASLSQNQRPEKIIGFLQMTADCMNKDNPISAPLNQVRFLFPGILKTTETSDAESDIKLSPLVQTTNRGGSWQPTNPYELTMMNPARLWDRFVEGTEPLQIGYAITGRLKSNFPDGITIASDDPNTPPEQRTGLTQSSEDSAVVVFADVDFISDIVAYQKTIFGTTVIGDNSALLHNTIEDLSGSSDLISIRSRGNFRRPFSVIDKIEAQAEEEMLEEEKKIDAEIAGFQQKLQLILSSAKEGEQGLVGSTILREKKEAELALYQAQQQKIKIKRTRLEQVEAVGQRLEKINTLLAPSIILLIAIILGIRRSTKRHFYASHAHDSD